MVYTDHQTRGKRYLLPRAVACAALVALCPAVLCRADSTRPPLWKNNLQVAVWGDGPAVNLGPLQQLAEDFRKNHGVIVNLERHPSASAPGLLQEWTDPRMDTEPDLLVISGGWLAEFRDAWAPLDSVAASGCRTTARELSVGK